MFPNRGLWAIWRLLIGMDLCRYVRPQFAHVSLPSNLFCSRLAFSFQLTSSHNIHTQTHTYIIHTIGFPLNFHLVNEEKADSNVITQSHDRRQCLLACRLCIVTGFSFLLLFLHSESASECLPWPFNSNGFPLLSCVHCTDVFSKNILHRYVSISKFPSRSINRIRLLGLAMLESLHWDSLKGRK